MAAPQLAVINVEVPAALAEQVRAVLPGYDGIGPWSGDGLMVTTARTDEVPLADLLRDLPPLVAEVSLAREPIAGADLLRWIELAGTDRATVTWWLPGWPALPQLDLLEQRKHAHVQLTLNTRDIDELHPAPDHTVYVHVGGREEEQRRASWLAAQIGHAVIGQPEWGW